MNENSETPFDSQPSASSSEASDIPVPEDSGANPATTVPGDQGSHGPGPRQLSMPAGISRDPAPAISVEEWDPLKLHAIGFLDASKTDAPVKAEAVGTEHGKFDVLWESRLRERELALNALENALRKRAEDLAKKEAEIANQKRSLLEREVNAAASFAKQNEEALHPLEQELARLRRSAEEMQEQLRARREAVDREIETRAVQKLQTLDEELDAMRKQTTQEVERMRQAVRQEREQFDQKCAAEIESILETRRRVLTELELKRGQLQKANERSLEEAFSAARDKLERDRLELEKRRAEIKVHFNQISQERNAIALEIERGVSMERARMDLELREAQTRAELWQRDRDKLEQQIAELRQEKHRFGSRPPDEIFAQIKTQEQEIAKLTAELRSRPDETEVKRLGELQTRYDEVCESRRKLDRENRDLIEKNARLKDDLSRSRTGQLAVELLRNEKEAFESQSLQLKSIIDLKQKQLDELRSQITVTAEDAKTILRETEAWKLRLGDLRDPAIDTIRQGRSSATAIREMEWLNELEKKIAAAHFHFPRRLLHAFHTCLKIADWAPLTVLAGVSGTGKSELPRLYSRFGGLYFLQVSVQPNWDSPQDVFGYYNSMDNRFHARPLLRAMVQSQLKDKDGPGFPEHMLLALLDEMNLARVELYLSDLLSKWELRRGESVQLEIDLGPDCEKENVQLSENALFVGTINEDESTQALSDKVLDRGNLLYFPRPKELRSREDLNLGARQTAMLEFKHWKSWRKKPGELRKAADSACEKYRAVLQEINRKLATVERAMGHRVWQSVEVYIANHPEVCLAIESGVEDKLETAIGRAFEDQIVQKIVPKLRGIETDQAARKVCLEPIRKLISAHAPRLEEDFAAALESGRRTFFWQQSNYLEADSVS